MKIIRYISFILVFCKSYAWQHTSIADQVKDSIVLSILKSHNDRDIEKIISLKAENQEYDTAFLLSNYFLQNSVYTENNIAQISAYNWLAYLSYITGNQQEVISNSQKGVDLFFEKKLLNAKHTIFNLLLIQGHAYTDLGEYQNAITSYHKGNELLDPKVIDQQKLSNVLSIGHCRIRIKRYKDAIKDFTFVLNSLKNKNIYNSISDYNRIPMAFAAYNRMGICYREMGELNKSIDFFCKNIDSSIANGHKTNLGISNMNMGISLHRKKKFQSAKEYLFRAQNSFESKKNISQNELIIKFHIADILHKEGKYIETELYTNRLTQELTKNSKIEYAVEMMELAIKNAIALNNKENQLSHRALLTSIQKKLYQDRSTTKDLIFDKQTTQLTNDKNQLYSLNKKSKTISIIIVLCSLTLSLIFIYHVRKTRKKNKLLFDELERKLALKEEELKTTTKSKKNKTIKVDNQKTTLILEQLDSLEKTFFFKDQNCTLHTTAQMINTNTSYLSKIINQYKQQSFNDYINELRIYYVLDQIKEDSKYKSYTIKGISEDVGYKSVNTFNNAFKKITNISPSYYLKQINQNSLIHS